jgi:hypothetical protein
MLVSTYIIVLVYIFVNNKFYAFFFFFFALRGKKGKHLQERSFMT